MAKKFNVGINTGWCKGCYLCMGVCPKSVLEMSDRIKATSVRGDDCIGCMQCEYVCPDLAITVTEQSS